MKKRYFITAFIFLIPLYNYGQWSNTTDNYTNGRLSLRQTSASLGDIISLYGNRLDNASMYGFGVEGSTIYYKTYANHRWYVGTNADDGTSSTMELNNTRLYINGNIGIGTSSPDQSLEVITPYSNNVDEEIRIGTNIPNIGFTGLGFNFYSNETGAFSRQITEYVGGNKYIPMKFSYGNTLFNGNAIFLKNIGIGTSSPDQSLEVITPYSNNVDEEIRIGTNIPNIGFTGLGFNFYSNETGAFSRQITEYVGGNKYIPIKFSYGNTLFNGNVCIGTANDYGYKLAVNGTIGAKEIKVTNDIVANGIYINSQPTADFVFEEDYNLRSIEAVEDFINENKHLPEIESAEEMEKNGINQAEMNQKLLQKVEELTLYMIDLNRRVKSLEKENSTLKKENSILKTQ